MIAMDVSTENAILYVCSTVVVLVAIVAWTLVSIFGNEDDTDDV